MPKDKTMIIVGVGAAALVAYFIFKKSSTPASTTTLPYAPTSGSGTTASVATGLAALLKPISPSLSNLFGTQSSTPAFTPVQAATIPVTPATSPAASVNYINPSVAPLTITAPPAPTPDTVDTTAGDPSQSLNDVFA